MRSTIDLAHNLSLTVVAEGVEDETTMQHLIDYGCGAGQGYHFAKPLETGEIDIILSAAAARLTAGE